MANDDEPKNPWGEKPGETKPKPWTGGQKGGSGGPDDQKYSDLDDILRKAQDNFKSVFPGSNGDGVSGGTFVLIGLVVIIGLWLISGFHVVNPGEQAVIQRFGAWAYTQSDPGLGYHIPAPVETATIVNVQEIRKMTIGFADAFGRGASGRRDIPEESLMLTSDRNIVDLDLEIQWNIKSAEDYLFKIRDQENTIKKVAESAIREVVGQTNMFPIITNMRQEVADRTKDIIQKNLDEYQSGVNITQVLIQKAEVHPDVQDAFQDVQSAKQDGEDVQNRAEAYREDILPKARGEAIKLKQEAEAYKQSVIAKASGDAQRFEAVYAAYQKGEDVTRERIYLETMEGVLQNAQKVILSGDSSQGVVPYLPLDRLKQGPQQQDVKNAVQGNTAVQSQISVR